MRVVTSFGQVVDLGFAVKASRPKEEAARRSNVYPMDAHSESTETAQAVKMLTLFDGGTAMTI